MSDPGRASGASHRAHDLELVARAAAGDLRSREASVARERLASCPECAALAADLRAIAAATRELGPASQAGTIRAPRDFRLSETDAMRLRGRSRPGRAGAMAWWSTRSRGLGGAMATFGLVGLLLAAGLPSLGSGAASPTAGREFGAVEQQDSATAAPAVMPAASAIDAMRSSGDPAQFGDPSDDGPVSTIPARAALAGVSVAALVVGLTLLIAGRRGRPAAR